MNTFFSQLKKEAQEIRLSEAERKTMRHLLLSAIGPPSRVKSPIRVTPSPYFFFVVPRALMPTLAFVLVVTLVGSSSAYTAEGAIPGDFLYPIKINLNEPVRAALAVSSEAKAIWHAEAAERRMKEAEVLAARGTLSTGVKVELEANFNEHAAEIAAIVGTVEQEDPVAAADISTRFESSLAAHSALIARLGGEGESEVSRRESGNFARSLKEHERKIARAERGMSFEAESRESDEAEVQARATETEVAISASTEAHDDEDIAARIEENASTTLAEAEAQLEALKKSLSGTTSARVKAQIRGVRKQIERARGERKGESSGKRRIEALKNAATLKAFLEAQEKFRERALLPALEVEEDDGDDEDGGQNSGGDSDKRKQKKEDHDD